MLYNFMRKKPTNAPEVINTIMPALIATGFFDKTKVRGFSVYLHVEYFWSRSKKASFYKANRTFFASRTVHLEDFFYLEDKPFTDFLIAIIAEIILQACEELKLDTKPIIDLIQKYPLTQSEMSFLYSGYSIPPTPPDNPAWFLPLTDQELTLESRNDYQWIVKESYPVMIQKINEEILTINVNTDEDEDSLVAIANAAIKAPKATIVLAGERCPVHEKGLEIFKYLRRMKLDSFYSSRSMENLPKELLKLELSFLGLHMQTQHLDLSSLAHLEALEFLAFSYFSGTLELPPNLATLRVIELQDCTLHNLEFLTHLHNLQSFGLFCSKVKDLSALAKLDQLKYLGLTLNPDITDLDVIHNMPKLEFLSFASLKNLQKMPLMRNCINLRRVSIKACKNLTDLNGLAAASNLQELIIFHMDHLTPEHVSAFKGLKSLKAVRTDNLAIEKYLGIQRGLSSRPFQFSEYVPMSAQDIAEREQKLAWKQSTMPDMQPEILGEIKEVPSNQELAINIRLTAEWGSDAEIVALNDLGDEWEEILLDSDLGAWDGQEIGGGYRTIFYVGPDAEAMYVALKEELSILPAGSFVEFKDADRETIKTIHLGGK